MYILTVLGFFMTVVTCIDAAGLIQPIYRNHFLNWNCTGPNSNGLPDVCNNMCYGAFCQRLGHTFNYEPVDDSARSKRARNAGCGTINKCQSGEQYDEYPYSSTEQARPPTNPETNERLSVSRCVPKRQNSSKHPYPLTLAIFI